MREIRTSGLMSGERKRSDAHRAQATAPLLDSTDMADPGTILVSENTRSLTVEKFEFSPKGRLNLKGIEEEIEAYQVQFDLGESSSKETVMDV